MGILVTHDGKFHADDVFAVAALLLAEPETTILRTRDESRIAAAHIVVDVGGVYDEHTKRFDHHQRGGAGERAGNGIPYAAFGLVWKTYGTSLSGGSNIASRVEEVLVAPIDANDNGIDLSVPKGSIAPYDISDAVRAFIPTWQESSETDATFIEAVSCAKRIIEREIVRAGAVIAGMQKVIEAYEQSIDKRLIVLDEDYSWKDALARYPEPLYVVHPQNDTWRLYCVRDTPNLFVNRKDLPPSWAGLQDANLSRVTGVSDAVFAHRNRFMAVTKTKASALMLARLALAS